MNEMLLEPYSAFVGTRCVASGDLPTVVRASKSALDAEVDPHTPVLLFDNSTSRLVEVDFRGSLDEVLQRVAPLPESSASPSGENTEVKPGRPKLGVVPREVTLLPRHWDWLAGQPGGASVTLRRLVEEARRSSQASDRARQTIESLDRFMRVMAGDLPNFEEASRAFYRGEDERFQALIVSWPHDIRVHLNLLAEVANAARREANASNSK